jgi:hypothetical protein
MQIPPFVSRQEYASKPLNPASMNNFEAAIDTQLPVHFNISVSPDIMPLIVIVMLIRSNLMKQFHEQT